KQQQQQGQKQKQERQQRPAPPPVVPQISTLVTGAPDDTPLRPDEVAEMKVHLDYLRNYKAALRLQLNATEDLLVNGQREPTDRGVCRHLLAKLDRQAVDAALAREPLRSDANARARMLGGAVRLTGDVGVLLSYLETLQQLKSSTELAQGFSEAVKRIDFETLSASRLGRLLQLMLEIFQGPARVQMVLGLLANEAFRRAWDNAGDQLPDEVTQAFGPVRAVYRRATRGARGPARDAQQVMQGLLQVLSLPEGALNALPPPVRVELTDLALSTGAPREATDRAAAALLPGLAKAGREHSRLSLRYASRLLERHDDRRASEVLEQLKAAYPDFRLPARWLTALQAPRLDRVALQGELGKHRLTTGFWLDRQRDVWVRTAALADAARLTDEARLQRELALPGVAPVAVAGQTTELAYVAVAGPGQPLSPTSLGRDMATQLFVASSAARILHALALAGVTLPDAMADRFLLLSGPHPLLTLADLTGARATSTPEAGTTHAHAARELTRQILGDTVDQLSDELRTALSADGPLPALVTTLDRAALDIPRSA
ncbi:MAG: hypothetical protein AB2A00_39705, partial [Myxococcota bacterium]